MATDSTPRLRWLARWLALGMGLTVIVTAVALVVIARRGPGAMPPLTRADFERARARWRSAGPATYEVEVQVSGRQAATYRVQVREGKVYEATRNGRPLRQQRTMGTWSVPGMFGTIESDLRNIEQILSGTAAPELPQLNVRAEFHPVYGYPQRYFRAELRRIGSNPPVSWQVTAFKDLSGRSAQAAAESGTPTQTQDKGN